MDVKVGEGEGKDSRVLRLKPGKPMECRRRLWSSDPWVGKGRTAVAVDQ